MSVDAVLDCFEKAILEALIAEIGLKLSGSVDLEYFFVAADLLFNGSNLLQYLSGGIESLLTTKRGPSVAGELRAPPVDARIFRSIETILGHAFKGFGMSANMNYIKLACVNRAQLELKFFNILKVEVYINMVSPLFITQKSYKCLKQCDEFIGFTHF